MSTHTFYSLPSRRKREKLVPVPVCSDDASESETTMSDELKSRTRSHPKLRRTQSQVIFLTADCWIDLDRFEVSSIFQFNSIQCKFINSQLREHIMEHK